MTDFLNSLLSSLKSNSDKVAIVDRNGSRRTTFAQLYAEAQRFAAYVNDADARIVAISMPKSMEYFAAEIGCWMAGCTVVPMGENFPKERIDYIMKHSGAKLLIRSLNGIGYGFGFGENEKANAKAKAIANANEQLTINNEQLAKAKAIANAKVSPNGGDLEEASALAIFYTSGSTGMPKGVVHTHESFANAVERNIELSEMTPSDVLGNSAPMYFIASVFDYTALIQGVTIHIYPEEVRTDVKLMSKYILEHEITLCFMSPTIVAQYTEPSPYLRLVITASERLSDVKPEGYKLKNCYGQTESAGIVTSFVVNDKFGNTPIGKPAKNVELSIQDEDGHQLQDGEEGEICLKGQFSIGYYKDEERTSKLLKNGWLHTGDLGKILPDGNLLYVNRKDWMVKISGQRVEPGEVEEVMKKCPGVENAIVKGFENRQGKSYLCAFYIAKANANEQLTINNEQLAKANACANRPRLNISVCDDSRFISTKESSSLIMPRCSQGSARSVNADIIEDYLRKYLPEYMIPSCYSKVEVFPLNANGKIDRKALISPLETKNSANETLTSVEKEVKEVIASLLETSDFGRNDNLGFLGLNSILATKLASVIYKKYGVQLNTRTLVKNATLKSVSDSIGIGTRVNEHSSLSTLNSSLNSPLTFSQLGVYADCISAPKSVRYNLPFAVKMPNGTEIKELADALRKFVTLHPYLNCCFVNNEEGDVVQKLRKDTTVDIPVKECSLDNVIGIIKEFVRPFDLEHGPLFRFEIVKVLTLNSQLSTLNLLVDFHHLIADGASIDLFFTQLCAILNEEELEPEHYDYLQFAADQTLDVEAEEFFALQMAKIEKASMLSVDVNNPEGQHRQGELFTPIDIQPAEAIARQLGITPASVYLAATAFTIGKYVADENVSLCTISNGRSDSRIAENVGMFVNTLPLVCNVDGKQTVSDFLRNTADMFSETIAHENYPFAKIAQKYDFAANILFAYQVGVINKYTTSNGALEIENLEGDIAKFPCSVFIEGAGKEGIFHIKFDKDLYSEAMMHDFCQSVNKVVEQLSVSTCMLSELSIVSDDQQKLLDTFHTTATAEVPFHRFYEPIDYWAEKTPDAKAIIACDRTLTYKELKEETDRIAEDLKARGIKPGDRVVLLMPRTSEVLCAMFGVSKAGAAYIPCDPSYPEERINLILEDSEARFIITTSDRLAEFPDRAIDVEELLKSEQLKVKSEKFLAPSLEGRAGGEASSSLAYLIYTSGSTGRPKGVMLRHEGICNYLYDHPANRHIHALVESGVKAYMCITTLSFDMSLKEFGVALHNGLTCVLANEEETENPVLLAELMKRTGAEALNATPSRLLGYMEIPEFEEALTHCKIVMSGGEKYSPVLLDKLHSIKGLRVFNTYGPTEITVSSNAAELTHTSQITIGQPLLNYHEWVVDAYGNELPAGVVGELYIGGVGVAAGYNNLPEKTAAAFVEFKSIRVYKSGDYARWTRDGRIEVLGRLDGQIKLHGLRIEIGEIETCINQYEGIKQSLVKVCKIKDDEYLVAYFTADKQIDTDHLKAEISKTLTHYMVPSAFMQLDAFPLTPNGKTDVKNLPEPAPGSTGSPTIANAKANANAKADSLNILEKQIYDIIAGVLKMSLLSDIEKPEFCRETQLSTLGLSSLSAIKLATLIFKRYNIQLKSQELVKSGTLASIEDKVLEKMFGNANADVGACSQVSPNGGDLEGASPLTFAQQGVYIDCIKNPETTLYNIPKMITFPEGVTPDLLTGAIRDTVDNHQSFRLVFGSEHGEPRQIFKSDIKVEIPVKEMTEAELNEYSKTFVRPFDLEHGPLFRFEIIKTPLPRGEGSGERLLNLLVDIHHLIADGASLDIVLKEITAHIDGFSVEKEGLTYLQFAEEQKNSENGDGYQSAREYFHQRLSLCEGASEITPDLQKNDAAEHTMGTYFHPIDFDAARQLALNLGVTPMSVFLAAAYYTVCRYVNNKQVYLATISNGRSNLKTFNTTGMFVNTLALSSEIKEQTVEGFIRETADDFAMTISHEQYPFAQIAADYNYQPEIVFEYQVGVSDSYKVNGEELKLSYLTLDYAKFKLKIAIVSTEVGYRILINYDEAFYSPNLIEGLAESYAAVVSHFVSQQGELVKKISIMSPAQEEAVKKMHTTATAEVPFHRFHEPIDYWAEKTPDAKAIIACDRTLTYKELKEETDRIAEDLKARGIKPGDRVVLLMPRTSEVLCAMFGVSKAGAAYIPCDPSYPEERINLILEDSGAKLIISEKLKVKSEKFLAPSLGAFSPEIRSTREARAGGEASSSLAYLIYTSGSTGRPKGVMLRHEGICNYLYDHPANRHIHALKEEGVTAFLCITTLSFDMSLKEFAGALHNGLTCVLANEDEVNNPMLLAELFRKTGAQAINGTPSRILNLMESEDFCRALAQCKVVMCGGEKYSDILLERLKAMGVRIFNTYGPTEITVSSNVAELTNQTNISIGAPLLNYTEFVVDCDGNELPVGVVGELYIGGPGVAVGYNNLPEQTADRFIEYHGQRVYKSGDYARWLPDGQVETLGRLDNQVKLNGLRIELGEVESAISKVEGIKQVVVMICNIDERDHLAAYFVAEKQIDVETLKTEISKTLTHYMVPTAYLQMDKFPLTPNGKVDLRHLPNPSLSQAGGNYVAPKNKAEEDFCHIFEHILNLERVSAADSFFEIGGTSLNATRVLIEAMNHSYTIAYADVFKYPTPRQLAQLTVNNEQLTTNNEQLTTNNEQLTNNNDANVNSQLSTLNSQLNSPLTFAQTGVYYDIVKTPGMTAYNMPSQYTFPEGVTAEKLVDAVKLVIAAHPILGARFMIQGNDVVQVCPENFNPEVEIVSVSSREELEIIKADFIKPFNPAKGPLFRAMVVSINNEQLTTNNEQLTNNNEHSSLFSNLSTLNSKLKTILLLDTSHLVMDGASKGIFNRQLMEALGGVKPELENYTYFDFAKDEKALVESAEYAESEAFFTERLKTVDGVSNITEDMQLNSQLSTLNSQLSTADAAVDHMRVAQAAKQMGVTPMSLFLAAAYYTTCRYTNTKDVCLCTISNGRSNLRVSDTVGMFVNTIALTSHITDVKVKDFIKHTAEDFMQTLEHENYPFAQIAQKFDLTPTLFFQYQVGIHDDLGFVYEPFGNAQPKFKFTISIEETGIQVQYDDSLYSKELSQGFAESMASVLEHFMEQPEKRLLQVSMLSDEAAKRIEGFKQTKQADVPIQLYHRLFEKSVEEHPDDLALVALNPLTNIYSSLTYSELNDSMNRIACSLIEKGVKPGDRVALLLPRTSRLIMSQFGVLKAGGAYIPCDPKYPTERINLILDDSEARFIITTSDRLAEFPDRAIDVEELLKRSLSPSLASRADLISGLKAPREGALAYLIYTSGSTGRPKGVQLTHAGVCNYHHKYNIIQKCLCEECHVALGITTISFDMSVWETGSPLMHGKTLVLVGDDDCNDPNRLAALINDYGVDCMTATTSRFMQLLESPAFEEAFSKHIHLAYQGGEGLSMALLRKLQSYPNVRIFNGYGPTETIANSHAAELTHADIAHIGKPCVNYTNFIVDSDGNEVPVGVVGELIIGGKSVARGYNNLPEQTADRFIEYHGQRVYKSGDYARWLPDGNVMVLGRKDNQVKLRGLRIELGEVETAITKVPGVKNVAVMIKKLSGKDHLCAYFTAERQISIDEMKTEISKTLTHYMVPTAYLQMSAFPLTPNGKTDVKHLPEPVLAQVGGEYVAPANKAEQDFCEIFGKILDLDKVSATDSFFDLGGSSLTATRVVIEATNLSYTIAYADVFNNPTPRQLAALSERSCKSNTMKLASIVEMQPSVDTKCQELKVNARANEGRGTSSLDDYAECSRVSIRSIKSEKLGLASIVETQPSVNACSQVSPNGGDLEGASAEASDEAIINSLLANNTVDSFRNGERLELGDVILTGANGYLGIHILHDLLENHLVEHPEYKVYCLVRHGRNGMSSEKRLTNLLFYYFEKNYKDMLGKQFFVIDGDVTNPEAFDAIPLTQPSAKPTLINCAAIVKHFSKGTEIEDINVGGLQNCVDFCLRTGARLIQTSTGSTAGQSVDGNPPIDTVLTEQTCNIGQELRSKYAMSKFVAERIVFKAIAEKGLVGKVVRLGNLAPRVTDGEFQINFRTNSSMGRLHVFQMLGCMGYSAAEGMMEFSPIDEVAHAILLLSQTPKECCVFHPVNNHLVLLGDVVREMAKVLDVNIEEVEDSEFQRRLMEAGQDPEKALVLQSMLAYSNAREKLVYLKSANHYTNNILSRLGFHWNVTSWDYVRRFVKAISALDFFGDKR